MIHRYDYGRASIPLVEVRRHAAAVVATKVIVAADVRMEAVAVDAATEAAVHVVVAAAVATAQQDETAAAVDSSSRSRFSKTEK